MIIKSHEPILRIDKTTDGYILVCKDCGKVLWYQDTDDECKSPTALGISVMEGIGTKDKFGG
jgi:hypothetical protein